MAIRQELFGTLPNGLDVTEYILTNDRGTEVRILDYGCILQSLTVLGIDVVLGFDTLAEYVADDSHFGAVVGRVANRISEGMFRLNGNSYQLAINAAPNHIHGGFRGFDRYRWDARIEGEALVLSRTSPEGEEGYPGELHVQVTYELTDQNILRITYDAVPEEDTILNLTSHGYFNLNGQGSGTAADHVLQIHANEFTENDVCSVPTGRISLVEGTPFDFRNPARISSRIEDEHPQIRYGKGYDINFVLDGKGTFARAATMVGDRTGLGMTVFTDRPGLQLYTANHLGERPGKGGAVYRSRDAVCLETQGFPDAVNHKNFPSVIVRGGETYHSVTEYRFG